MQSSFSERPAQAPVTQMLAAVAQWRSERAAGADDGGGHDPDLDRLAHLWQGYLAHGARQLACVDSGRVILASEQGGGCGLADLVVGRRLIEVKAAFDPAASMGDWLNQVLAYALLDWSDALGVNTIPTSDSRRCWSLSPSAACSPRQPREELLRWRVFAPTSAVRCRRTGRIIRPANAPALSAVRHARPANFGGATETMTACTPCTPVLSNGVRIDSVLAGQVSGDVWRRLALSAETEGRWHLVLSLAFLNVFARRGSEWPSACASVPTRRFRSAVRQDDIEHPSSKAWERR
jgi:hypothetical protein